MLSVVSAILLLKFILLYTAWDYNKKAFALLNKSYEEKNSSLLFIKVEPMFYDLHDDDRFDKIVKKIGL